MTYGSQKSPKSEFATDPQIGRQRIGATRAQHITAFNRPRGRTRDTHDHQPSERGAHRHSFRGHARHSAVLRMYGWSGASRTARTCQPMRQGGGHAVPLIHHAIEWRKEGAPACRVMSPATRPSVGTCVMQVQSFISVETIRGQTTRTYHSPLRRLTMTLRMRTRQRGMRSEGRP
jgi:hypothetical protein